MGGHWTSDREGEAHGKVKGDILGTGDMFNSPSLLSCPEYESLRAGEKRKQVANLIATQGRQLLLNYLGPTAVPTTGQLRGPLSKSLS